MTEQSLERRECIRCLYSRDNVTGISFDQRGVCNYCVTIEMMETEYPMGAEGRRRLEAVAKQIREEGKGKQYDVAVGVSGGCDSSYMLVLARELGLRPLAVHFDNTWNSTTAVENIQNVLRSLDIDLYTYVVDNEEMDDIFRSFFLAGTPDLEAPTDLGLAVVLNKACEKYGIRHIFEGHSFRTEGICPIGWLYMDARYIASVHSQFGRRKMNTYPNMWMKDFLRWTVSQPLQKIRPLYWLDYRKEATKQMLTEEHGWTWYGGHHLENRFTNFFHTYFWPRRWGIDGRLLGHCALVRSGQLDRETAKEELRNPAPYDPEIVELVKKRLNLSDEQFEQGMTQAPKTYRDFPNYKRTFELMRPLWWALYKAQRVPKSFYLKYCFPHNDVPFRGHDQRHLRGNAEIHTASRGKLATPAP
jgi:N-acetyl sugar amidotransferase